MKALALRAEDRGEFDGALDGTEPVRRQRRELVLELDDAEAALLAAAGVTVDERRVVELRGPGDEMETVALDDGTERACGGLLVPVTTHQRSTLAQQLGARAAQPGPVAADEIDVDAMVQTSAAGVSAAGDVSSQMPSAASAIAAGSMAAAMIVRAIVAETHLAT
ncbi:hypothetical protein BH24ACT6_BH24ACT6_04600 [soil metagenome]